MRGIALAILTAGLLIATSIDTKSDAEARQFSGWFLLAALAVTIMVIIAGV